VTGGCTQLAICGFHSGDSRGNKMWKLVPSGPVSQWMLPPSSSTSDPTMDRLRISGLWLCRQGVCRPASETPAFPEGFWGSFLNEGRPAAKLFHARLFGGRCGSSFPSLRLDGTNDY
jgi:hypothetical protein